MAETNNKYDIRIHDVVSINRDKFNTKSVFHNIKTKGVVVWLDVANNLAAVVWIEDIGLTRHWHFDNLVVILRRK